MLVGEHQNKTPYWLYSLFEDEDKRGVDTFSTVSIGIARNDVLERDKTASDPCVCSHT